MKFIVRFRVCTTLGLSSGIGNLTNLHERCTHKSIPNLAWSFYAVSKEIFFFYNGSTILFNGLSFLNFNQVWNYVWAHLSYRF